MYELNIHISNSYKSSLTNIDLNFLLKNNNKINIIEHDNYDNKEKLDLNIRHSSYYTFKYIDIFYNNTVFINTFRDKVTFGNIFEYSDDLTIFPFSFVNKFYSKFYIQQQLDYYKKLYNNNLISKSYGTKYWLVKSLNGYNSIDMLLLTDDQLLQYNNNDLFFQKYLEDTLIINKKKYNIKSHIMIFPKIIKNNTTNKYEIKYSSNNDIEYRIYLHDYIMYRHTINDYIHGDTSLKNFNTMQIIQGFNVNNLIRCEDKQIINLILNALKRLKHNKKFQKMIQKSIYGYPYFGQLINIDFEIDNSKNTISIEKITCNMGLDYDKIRETSIITSFYQKLIKCVFKIKYNILINYKNKYTKDLILI